jgi:hypothetical protein
MNHDPLKILESLQNHLTQPEANILFLIGAGASSAVRIKDGDAGTRSLIPSVAELTARCVEEIRNLDGNGAPGKFSAAYKAVEEEVHPKSRPTNIEDVLTCVRRKLQAMRATDSLSGLDRDGFVTFEKSIRSTIASQVNPPKELIPEKLPHDDFVRWIVRMPRAHPVEIFTTNYDVLLETALEAARVPAFDGFVGCNRPFFCHETLTRPEAAPASGWTRLWKIHGSINWKADSIGSKQRVIRTAPHNEGEMILPSHHKYDESRKQPYSALLDRFTRALDRDDAILFACGYSFSDEHINAIIFDALEAKRRPHVIAMQYEDAADDSVLADRAGRYTNLMVLGPRTAWIGGKRGSWKLQELPQAPQIAHAFELDAPPSGKPHNGEGALLLGDFNRFAAFLGALTKNN